ncbi:DNA polymerase III subunit gamma/tau [Chitinophaga ginsengisegetis]|uniref:DNA polymerase III subunit gamma/tau n=1 Tax=Chitinophaga ginsengisegetis TaxID=393003 RepID=UPI000DB8FD3D|nr:DNA polymerase III subunit gamma/tau [Chitinophaga ginsengisegetis]MDR6565411.1 DNA polymerase-3 subunit gamma/tau [Chitinophaga ginsengisegetis]MDR6645139.1 DNA polymerase-3 subunit gamma/tau [Chitinophaga ginsengisegetis]MDR6652269.1 DNA polymerase-3 subunit gamma/tau [Chitinophaga ginsengisegetis]
MENFIVSARKYRPQNFSTVVGQAHITTTLKNAIRNNQLAHAFLFCGPRGVGKTTCARILAKTINCENLQPDGEACNECHSCKSFNEGSSFNIHELDAASNNSVDDIRTLVEQVRFAPQAGKYKIYIIDEVHMLSSSAFNAFLKTLEEPPSYAIFILATTEKHKILPTILSRCQIFDFKRITIQDTVDHLQEICTKEHIQAETDALHLVAQKTDGCMRDSLSTLDKIVSFTSGHLTYQNTLEHLNILDYDYFFRVMASVLQQDVANALLIFDEILQKGFEGDNFLNGWAEFLRNLLLCKEDKALHLVEVSGNLKERYKQLSGQVSPAYLITALHLLNETEINYRMARNKRLHVEMALIKLCFLQQAVTLVSDDSNGEVSKKKLVADGSPPQKLRAPVAQPVTAKTITGNPATTESIGTVPGPRLTVDTPVQPTQVPPAPQQAASAPVAAPVTAPVPAPSAPTPSVPSNGHTAVTGGPATAPVTTTPVGSQPAATATAPAPVATPPAGGATTTTAAPASKLTGLAAMKEAMAAKQQGTTQVQSTPLTMGAIHVYWEEFIDLYRQANKMTVVSNLQLAQLKLLGTTEVGIVSRNIVQFRFMEEEKLVIAEFLKKKFNNPTIVLTLQLDESQQTQDIGPAPLSSREQFQQMAEKYPLVKELKDRLNMELDF